MDLASERGDKSREMFMWWQTAIAACTPLRTAIVLAVVGVFIAAPMIRDELLLQFQCHLNVTSVAQENVRLKQEIDSLREEVANLREEKRQHMNEADREHSRANRSYWEAVTQTVGISFLVILTLCCCCWYYIGPWLRPQHPRRHRRQYMLG